MRQEFLNRLKALLNEKYVGGWKDGWVYGRLKEEFALQPDELDKIAADLGFKYGWNPMVEDVLENQWRKDESIWMQQKLNLLETSAVEEKPTQPVNNPIDLLRDAIKELENLGTQLKHQCELSKSKAVESAYKVELAQRAANQEDVFQNSVNKAVNIKFVKTIEPQVTKIETTIARLKTYVDLLRRSSTQ